MAKSKTSTVTTKEPNAVVKYFNDTRAELRRVTWPTREETKNLTLIIVAVTIAMSLFLGLLDFLFQFVTARIISGDLIGIVLGIILFIGGTAAFYFNNQEAV